MNLKKLFLIGLICAFLAPTNVFAEKSKWSFTPYLGVNAATSRDMVNDITGTTAVAVTVNGYVISGTLTASVDELSFSDTHNTPILTGFDVGYFLRDDLEVFGGFEFVHASGDSTKALTVTGTGTVTDPNGTVFTGTVGDTVNAEFENYNSWALKIGATKHFPMGDYTPYIGGYGGFKHVNEMKLDLKFNAVALTATGIKFYDATNTGFFGFHTGVNTNVTMGGTPVSLGIRARLDYTPELNNDNSDLDLLGAGTVNDAGGGVDFGLTAQVTIPF